MTGLASAKPDPEHDSQGDAVLLRQIQQDPATVVGDDAFGEVLETDIGTNGHDRLAPVPDEDAARDQDLSRERLPLDKDGIENLIAELSTAA